MTPRRFCQRPVEPYTLTDELPGGRAETDLCAACFKEGCQWAEEDQRRHAAIERRASAWRSGHVGLFELR